MNTLKHSNPFTAVPNAVLGDPNLSFKAKGIYAYLFSKPDGWVFYNNAIMKETAEGISSFQSGIKELVKHGWIKKHQSILENGRFGGIEYELKTDTPEHNNRPTATHKKEEKEQDLPSTEKPSTEKPLTENRMTYKERTKKERINKKNNSLKRVTKKETPTYYDFSKIEGLEDVRNIQITTEKVQRLWNKYGHNNHQRFKDVVLDFNSYLVNDLRGRAYKDHYLALAKWFRKGADFNKFPKHIAYKTAQQRTQENLNMVPAIHHEGNV